MSNNGGVIIDTRPYITQTQQEYCQQLPTYTLAKEHYIVDLVKLDEYEVAIHFKIDCKVLYALSTSSKAQKHYCLAKHNA